MTDLEEGLIHGYQQERGGHYTVYVVMHILSANFGLLQTESDFETNRDKRTMQVLCQTKEMLRYSRYLWEFGVASRA